MQAGSERLLVPDKMHPWPELAAMGVAGQLQVETGSRGGGGAARLMGQQQTHPCSGGRTGHCRGRIAAMVLVEMMGVVVGHAGNHHHVGVAIDRRASRAVTGFMVQHLVFVHQHLDAQATQFINPGMGARVVLMVAGHEKSPMCRCQVR